MDTTLIRSCLEKFGLALAADFDHGFTLVRAAVRANAVNDVIFVAVFAANEMIQRERIMRTAAVASADGMFSFWQRTHNTTPSICQSHRRSDGLDTAVDEGKL